MSKSLVTNRYFGTNEKNSLCISYSKSLFSVSPIITISRISLVLVTIFCCAYLYNNNLSGNYVIELNKNNLKCCEQLTKLFSEIDFKTNPSKIGRYLDSFMRLRTSDLEKLYFYDIIKDGVLDRLEKEMNVFLRLVQTNPGFYDINKNEFQENGIRESFQYIQKGVLGLKLLDEMTEKRLYKDGTTDTIEFKIDSNWSTREVAPIYVPRRISRLLFDNGNPADRAAIVGLNKSLTSIDCADSAANYTTNSKFFTGIHNFPYRNIYPKYNMDNAFSNNSPASAAPIGQQYKVPDTFLYEPRQMINDFPHIDLSNFDLDYDLFYNTNLRIPPNQPGGCLQMLEYYTRTLPEWRNKNCLLNRLLGGKFNYLIHPEFQKCLDIFKSISFSSKIKNSITTYTPMERNAVEVMGKSINHYCRILEDVLSKIKKISLKKENIDVGNETFGVTIKDFISSLLIGRKKFQLDENNAFATQNIKRVVYSMGKFLESSLKCNTQSTIISNQKDSEIFNQYHKDIVSLLKDVNPKMLQKDGEGKFLNNIGRASTLYSSDFDAKAKGFMPQAQRLHPFNIPRHPIINFAPTTNRRGWWNHLTELDRIATISQPASADRNAKLTAIRTAAPNSQYIQANNTDYITNAEQQYLERNGSESLRNPKNELAYSDIRSDVDTKLFLKIDPLNPDKESVSKMYSALEYYLFSRYLKVLTKEYFDKSSQVKEKIFLQNLHEDCIPSRWLRHSLISLNSCYENENPDSAVATSESKEVECYYAAFKQIYDSNEKLFTEIIDSYKEYTDLYSSILNCSISFKDCFNLTKVYPKKVQGDQDFFTLCSLNVYNFFVSFRNSQVISFIEASLNYIGCNIIGLFKLIYENNYYENKSFNYTSYVFYFAICLLCLVSGYFIINKYIVEAFFGSKNLFLSKTSSYLNILNYGTPSRLEASFFNNILLNDILLGIIVPFVILIPSILKAYKSYTEKIKYATDFVNNNFFNIPSIIINSNNNKLFNLTLNESYNWMNKYLKQRVHRKILSFTPAAYDAYVNQLTNYPYRNFISESLANYETNLSNLPTNVIVNALVNVNTFTKRLSLNDIEAANFATNLKFNHILANGRAVNTQAIDEDGLDSTLGTSTIINADISKMGIHTQFYYYFDVYALIAEKVRSLNTVDIDTLSSVQKTFLNDNNHIFDLFWEYIVKITRPVAKKTAHLYNTMIDLCNKNQNIPNLDSNIEINTDRTGDNLMAIKLHLEFYSLCSIIWLFFKYIRDYRYVKNSVYISSRTQNLQKRFFYFALVFLFGAFILLLNLNSRNITDILTFLNKGFDVKSKLTSIYIQKDMSKIPSHFQNNKELVANYQNSSIQSSDYSKNNYLKISNSTPSRNEADKFNLSVNILRNMFNIHTDNIKIFENTTGTSLYTHDLFANIFGQDTNSFIKTGNYINMEYNNYSFVMRKILGPEEGLISKKDKTTLLLDFNNFNRDQANLISDETNIREHFTVHGKYKDYFERLKNDGQLRIFRLNHTYNINFSLNYFLSFFKSECLLLILGMVILNYIFVNFVPALSPYYVCFY